MKNTTNFITLGDKTLLNLDAISYIKATPVGFGLTIVLPSTAEGESGNTLNISGQDAQTLLGELQKRGVQIPRGVQDAANAKSPINLDLLGGRAIVSSKPGEHFEALED